MDSRWFKIVATVSAIVPVTALAALATRRPAKGQVNGLGEGSWKQQSFSLFRETPKPKKKRSRAKAKRAVDAEAATAPAAADEQCLVLGRYHPHYAFGAYEVCLTKTQRKKLFAGTVGNKLGCGVFACAFETNDPEKVVKITRDPEDVAALIKAQKSGVVPKLYSAYTLGSDPKGKGISTKTGERTPAYALVVERLETLSAEKKDTHGGDIYNKVNEYLNGEIEVDEVCDLYDKVVCRSVKAAAKLKQATGIKWTDAHGGNIGYDKQGNLKILDLGVSKTALKRNPRILEGAAKRMRNRLAGL